MELATQLRMLQKRDGLLFFKKSLSDLMGCLTLDSYFLFYCYFFLCIDGTGHKKK